MARTDADVLIVGAGIAGASLAWRLAQPGAMQRSVLLIEMESQPGVHATGRSAAMFMESYGPPQARALTRAGRVFYESPPPGFTDVALLAPRGALYVAQPGQADLLSKTELELRAAGTAIERLGVHDALRLVPVLRRQLLLAALLESDARDIDVHALHQSFLRGARHGGAVLRVNSELLAARHDGAAWQITLADGATLRAATIVNAAGAWADVVAQRCGVGALGIEPRRRSAFTFHAPGGVHFADWPVVAGIDESWYFKPDAGHLLGSPANADPTHAHDVQAEEIDVATGIARIESATSLTIRRPASTWAGLRSFARDGELVIGADAHEPAFFWLAGQGGYGIQSAAGASLLAASLLTARPLPEELAGQGVMVDAMAPPRLAR